MALRALPADVQKMVDNTVDSVDLFIIQANAMVDSFLPITTMSAALLALIETSLAAHFALLAFEKGSLAEKTIGEATDKYHNVYKGGLSSTRYGQQVIMLDTSGKLAQLSEMAQNPSTKKALFTVVGTVTA